MPSMPEVISIGIYCHGGRSPSGGGVEGLDGPEHNNFFGLGVRVVCLRQRRLRSLEAISRYGADE